MLTWAGVKEATPDVAAAAESLLYEHGLGIGFLATVRPDGGPRVHPVCPLLHGDGLYLFVVPGPKLADLRRDGRFALHSDTCPPPRHDDGTYLTGTVRELDDPTLRARLTEQLLAERSLAEPWPGFEHEPLFELLVDRVLVTRTLPTPPLPAGHTVWRA